MFFKYHGNIQYDIFGTTFPMTDITKMSVTFDKNKMLLQTVSVNTKSPDQLAADLYSDPTLGWTILLVNNIVDPFTEWHMSDDHLYNYCVRIYGGVENMYKVKYFRNTVTDEIITGDLVKELQEMFDADELLPENIEFVRFYDYEVLRNAQRSVVFVIPKALITKFVEDFKSSLKGK